MAGKFRYYKLLAAVLALVVLLNIYFYSQYSSKKRARLKGYLNSAFIDHKEKK